ncbi:hypothetical protein Pst134EA_005299 [Puccinia striiformis f. sp. tritici]|uniref:hypothetical protein n=1 Tax=Puccinia striiformis f. sp. tritici TaxID=168172 RepID=UPI002008DFD2|nr:hypothetical protein Pst134EA_005299 [Puccinia striiformis f. sp. tritici]KAH9471398.1 hypothetical protein Pst134EA_005299 [Puccinia striiformis f. sp. tritici]
MANPANVAAGLKGTLNNPNVSDEAKHHAEHRLETQGYKSASAHDSGHTKDPENVKRGIKAALHVSQLLTSIRYSSVPFR